jgi:hypothetical protein
MLLNRLQGHLERIYEVESGYRVADFLIDDPSLARELDDTPHARNIPEKLLIRQEGDTIDLALYLDPDLVQRLFANDPTQSLHGENLHDFWTALEGISHFLYLTWNAHYERSVTLLELEMQAEIDKYILAAFLFGRQMDGRVPNALYHDLFKFVRFDERLSNTELRRYRNANYFAGRFCSYIEKKYLRPGAGQGLVNTLRRFYRLSQHRKIETIRQL